MAGILGKKVGMTQIFDEKGEVVPVTVIEAGPCFVTQVKTRERDGYQAVQIGFEETKPKRLTKGQQGHLQQNSLPLLRHLREIRVRDDTAFQLGQKLTVEMFETGERVDVEGKSKGRGFAGTIKRHGFHRQPKTHGQSDRERAPGSIGATTGTARVFKGKRMAGRMGNARVTSQNLLVALVDPERNLLAVRGSVPGPKGSLVLVVPARKQG
jgi:large subunit ribosomal protein L3